MNTTPSQNQEPPSDFGIRLLDKEEILLSLRPYRFKTYFFLTSAFPIFFVTFFVFFSFFAKLSMEKIPHFSFLLATIPFALLLLVSFLVFLYALIAERRYHYWLTNQRVIWCHGFIGYKIRSLPLERIVDVVISRTLLEMIAGISSIEIRDMAGQVQVRPGRNDLGAKWIGVENAPEVQKLILEQIRQVNERSRKV